MRSLRFSFRLRDPAAPTRPRDDGADRHPGEHVRGIVHAEHQARQRHRRHQQPAAAVSPVARLSSIAAAVVEVACADGKLSLLGVPTLTATAG